MGPTCFTGWLEELHDASVMRRRDQIPNALREQNNLPVTVTRWGAWAIHSWWKLSAAH